MQAPLSSFMISFDGWALGTPASFSLGRTMTRGRSSDEHWSLVAWVLTYEADHFRNEQQQLEMPSHWGAYDRQLLLMTQLVIDVDRVCRQVEFFSEIGGYQSVFTNYARTTSLKWWSHTKPLKCDNAVENYMLTCNPVLVKNRLILFPGHFCVPHMMLFWLICCMRIVCWWLLYIVHRVSIKKQPLWFSVITSANEDWFSKFFHWHVPKKSLCNCDRDFRLTLTMLLHYLVKF